MTDYENAVLLLTGLIQPRAAETEAERAALENAARAQAEYWQQLPQGLRSLNEGNDGVSAARVRGDMSFGVCPAAKGILRAAGLIGGSLPRARML